MDENFDVLLEIALRIAHEGHTPECSYYMAHGEPCTCPKDSGQCDPTDYLTYEEWQQIIGGKR